MGTARYLLRFLQLSLSEANIFSSLADDSYFDYAEAFLNNTLTAEQLARAMRLGKPGEQVVLKSQLAFSKIKYEGFEAAEKDLF